MIHCRGERLDLWQKREGKSCLYISTLQQEQRDKEIEKTRKRRGKKRTRWHSLSEEAAYRNMYPLCLSPSAPVLCCPLFSSLQPVQICSHLFSVTQPPPKPTFLSHLFPFFPCFEVVVTHPGGTIAGNFVPMHLPETCALRYGIQSRSHKQVDQPKYTSWDGNKGTRFSRRLHP